MASRAFYNLNKKLGNFKLFEGRKEKTDYKDKLQQDKNLLQKKLLH